MREILFRGKRIDNGEWVKGYYSYETDECSFELHLISDNKSVVTEVVPETVGQYTGLIDKNGRKIFEGDILHIAKISDGLGDYYHPPLDCPVNVVVKWDLCAWIWETLCDELCDDKMYITFPNAWCHYECEVIGNIHDKKLEDFENGC